MGLKRSGIPFAFSQRAEAFAQLSAANSLRRSSAESAWPETGARNSSAHWSETLRNLRLDGFCFPDWGDNPQDQRRQISGVVRVTAEKPNFFATNPKSAQRSSAEVE